MIRTLFVTARILLAIAWLVWLIFLFIPQVEFVVHGSSSYNNLFNGFVVTAAAFFFMLLEILDFSTMRPASSALAVVSFAIALNVLLFIASPFTLIKLKAGNLTHKSVYWILNVVCLILFVPAIPQILKPPDTQDGMIASYYQLLLPNFFLWLAAQVALTLASSARLLGEYIASRQEIVL
ncbi:MAG: hypothetical protein AABZ78_19615 [Chloroflexota bacterium]